MPKIRIFVFDLCDNGLISLLDLMACRLIMSRLRRVCLDSIFCSRFVCLPRKSSFSFEGLEASLAESWALENFSMASPNSSESKLDLSGLT